MALWRMALLVLLALGTQGVLAQAPQMEACRAPVLELQRPPVAFDPGSSVSLLMAIENANVAPVDSVRASITTTAPAGWTVIPAQRDLTIGPRNASITTLAVTAPNRGSGDAAGNLTVLVTFVCTSGDIQTGASAGAVLAVSLRALQAPWPIVLGAFALLAGGVILLAVRRLRRGIGLSTPSEERDVAPGHGAKFTFQVENRRGRPQRLRVEGRGLPEGWVIHLALQDLELEPGEEKVLWAILKAPPHALPGSAIDVSLVLHDARAAKDVAEATLRARVVA